jgi:hypothetical protein
MDGGGGQCRRREPESCPSRGPGAASDISRDISRQCSLSLCFCEEGGAREISHETLRVCTRTVKMVQARQLINDPDQKPFPAPLSHRPFCSPDSGSSFFSLPVLLCLLTARMVSLPFGCHISLWKPPFNEVSNFIYLCYYIKLIVTRFIFFLKPISSNIL